MNAQARDAERDLYQEIVRRIVAVADPDRIIVFGSRARGDHRPDSDLDILVIKESAEPRYKRARGLYGALASLPLEVDILVYTLQEVREWSEVSQALVTTAAREGLVVYERAARPRPQLVAES
jgi:uncharacterized protein